MDQANVNFGASKITVYGDTTIEELEKAGAFESLQLVPEDAPLPEKEKKSFWKTYQKEALSILFILLGYASFFTYGEEHGFTITSFAAAIIIGGTTLFITGLKNLSRLDFDMRTLMTIAVIGAAIIGEWGEAAVVVVLFAISEALETYSMDKARASIQSLMDIAPNEALIKRNGQEVTLHVKDIQIGDIMVIKPGQKIAMDGKITQGSSAINQAAITGESLPISKAEGDEVFAGTLNEEGYLEVEVTKTVQDTTLSKIIHLVEEAQAERAPSQHFVDKFAKYYTPVIILVALLVALVPPLLFGASWGTWVYQGLAVLVVGCPCALVISTPVAIVTAIGNAAKNGVLIKGGVYLEEMGAIRSIAFDKTGTLTKGTPEMTEYHLVASNSPDPMGWIAALEYKSQHPLAAAILQRADEKQIDYKQIEVSDFSALTGKGITGKIDGITYYIGSPSLFKNKAGYDEQITERIHDWQAQGNTVMLAGTDTHLHALIAVRDTIRKESSTIIKQLSELGINYTIMLTGDNQRTANAIGNEIGISQAKAELLPQDKLAFIKSYRDQYGSVAMVGDGVNDAPALASSTVGIAMGGAGTDTALETADIALMGDDLNKLPYTVKLSRKALAIIKQNITFSLVVKLAALLLVIPGWLTLWIAIFADMGATLLVTLNGLRLLRVKDN
ncbi:Cd2+/Zn2+-exporting ATPase [Thalassobacillus cyri]|uniref:Cd(2+)-exporting ATPase n=1 Tax=Thalassobacillus cyri TaxID=571932 RepID=A0A1H4H8G9_9BACI|nr:Cd2+/Zn2+-exporting ATPase [Thalassobacillus cyri]